MTLATVQMILVGLGLITGLSILILGPGKRWIRWPLALATGAGVAYSGWTGLWQVGTEPINQFYQSLTMGSVVVLLALLTMSLLYPSRRVKQRALDYELANESISHDSKTPAYSTFEEHPETAAREEPGRDPITIDSHYDASAKLSSEDEQALVQMFSANKPAPKPSSAKADSNTDSNYGLPPQEEEPLLIDVSGERPVTDSSITDAPVNIESSAPTASADVVSLAERREQQAGTDFADDFDVANSDELYQEMREIEADLDLTDDSDWLEEDVELEIDAHENIDLFSDDAGAQTVPANIEDAEILDSVDDIEASDEDDSAATDSSMNEVKAAQNQTIIKLRSESEALSEQLSKWQTQTGNREQPVGKASLLQGQTFEQQQQRLLSEENFREAAIELIQTQRNVMKQLMTKLNSLGAQRQQDIETLTALQQNVVTQRRIASQAALLARQAAADKRQLSSGLHDEKQLHERTKGAASRAMGIARDAVDKLAEHEKQLERITDSDTTS